MVDINQYAPRSGRLIKEDNTIVNEANGINADGSRNVQLTGSYQKYVVIANAVAVTDTTLRLYNLIQHGGLTEDVIRQFKDFKISAINSHDQAASVTVYVCNRALGLYDYSTAAIISVETLPASPGRLIIASAAGGTSSTIKVAPALRSVISNLIIGIQFGTAPTLGSFTIGVEMNG